MAKKEKWVNFVKKLGVGTLLAEAVLEHFPQLVYQNIPNGSDLNNYKEDFFGGSSSNTNASTILNRPTTAVAFYFEVKKTGNDSVQFMTSRALTTPRMWMRTYYAYGDVWTNWREIITTTPTPV